MCKYEMDPESIVKDTEQTLFTTNGQTDRWTEGQGETSIPLINFIEQGIY